jgi:serine/threonine protein kinase
MLPDPPDIVEIVLPGNRVLHVPRRFGRYEYLKTLGCGGSSAVVLVRNVVSLTLFACKIVSRQHLITENIFERFEQEVRLLPALNHPNIVRFEKILFHPEFIFLVMEYCSQGDLFSQIVSNGLFPESRAADIMRQIAEGVRYIHDKDIAHRDLKPENILLDGEFTAKIADFGLCHVASSRVLLRTPCGSPFYAPPEIINNQSYDGKSADIWSLGVLLFTMVTGALPWTSDNQAELFRQIKEAEVEIPPILSPLLQDLLRSMLQRDPSQRIGIREVLESQWLPTQSNNQWKEKVRSRALSWAVKHTDYIPPERAGPVSAKRLIMRPKTYRTTGLARSSHTGSIGTLDLPSLSGLGSLSWG